MYYNWKRDIFLFLTAETISLFGSSMVQYAIVWYITLTTSSGVMMTISTLCGFLPQILISLFAGVWVDRYNRKTMIILADGMIAFVTLMLAILFLLGYKNIWFLYLVLLVRSAGTGIQTPAVNALIPQIVPKENLMRVNGVNSSIASVMMFLSPVASGAILSMLSIETIFFIDVITAVIGVSIMCRITVATHTKQESQYQSNFQGLQQGLAYVKEDRWIKQLLIFLFVVMILISPSAFLTPLMVSRSFGPELWKLTVSEMTFSAGAVVGGFLITKWGGFPNRMQTAVWACVLYGLFMIGLGLAPTLFLYLIVNFLIGITMPCFNAPITVLLQEKVNPSMQGKVFSLVQIANSCAFPLGILLFGTLADYMKIENLLIFPGIIVVAYACYILFRKPFM